LCLLLVNLQTNFELLDRLVDLLDGFVPVAFEVMVGFLQFLASLPQFFNRFVDVQMAFTLFFAVRGPRPREKW